MTAIMQTRRIQRNNMFPTNLSFHKFAWNAEKRYTTSKILYHEHWSQTISNMVANSMIYILR